MFIGRWLGYAFLFLAGLALVFDLVDLVNTGRLALTALGERWFQVHPPSLNLLQATVERYLSPALWTWVLQPIMITPAVIALGVIGLLLTWLFKRP